jgi:hypothetical protein
MAAAAPIGCTAFCVFTQPVPLSISPYSLMRVNTEDGINSIPLLTSTTNQDDLEDFVKGVGFISSFRVPPHMKLGVQVLGADDAIVLAGDGSWRRKEREWGVGIVCRTTGHKWLSGGRLGAQNTVRCGNGNVDAAVIEALAIREMLYIGTARGDRVRRARASQRGGADKFQCWSTFAKHLIIVSDRTSIIGNIRKLATDKILTPTCESGVDKSAYDVMVKSSVVAIANACSVFERVSIIHKSQFSCEEEWSGHNWPPHVLAKLGCSVNQKSFVVDDDARPDMVVKIRDFCLEDTLYMRATFSASW